MFFDSLPKEVKLHIFTQLDQKSLRQLSQVSKECLQLADNNKLWYKRLQSDFGQQLLFSEQENYKPHYKALYEKKTLAKLNAIEAAISLDNYHTYLNEYAKLGEEIIKIIAQKLIKDSKTFIKITDELRRNKYELAILLIKRIIANDNYLEKIISDNNAFENVIRQIKIFSYNFMPILIENVMANEHIKRNLVQDKNAVYVLYNRLRFWEQPKPMAFG